VLEYDLLVSKILIEQSREGVQPVQI